MHRFYSLLASLFLLTSPVFASDHDHSHGHAEASPATLSLNQGKQWPTDAPLRENMAALAAMVQARVPAIHKGTLSAADYALLGAAIEKAVGDIVKNCALPADADAMLHLVIGDLLTAADTMQGTVQPNKISAAHQTIIALNRYGHFFKHPGWVPIH